MEEMEIGMAMSKLPLWMEFLLALGGLEFLKWAAHHIANWRSERRKNSAEAKQEEAVAHQQVATAGQQDADWRQKELELMTQFVDTAKAQFEDMKQRYSDLKAEKEEDRQIKEDLRRKIAGFEIWKAEQQRKTDGLQKAFTESEARRREAERLYCSVANCAVRVPPIGTYTTDIVEAKRGVKARTTKQIEDGRL